MKRFAVSSIGLAAVMAATMGTAQARDQVRIVGSSTVFPFASYVAEELGATTKWPTPVIESTGSGGGMKLFCEGNEMDTPDITNASRRMKPSEFERCQENGVTDITEAMVGYDGIAFAQSNTNDQVNLTREQIALALLEKVPQDGQLVDNPYMKWSDIDASLPAREIRVYGPPTTSGTRDAFEELVLEAVTEEMDAFGGEGYTNIRKDGAYIDAGENDNLIVQKLQNDVDAFGIFGYSFLEENANKLAGANIDGVAPEPEAIGSGEYPVSRSLWFYIKNSHADDVPAMGEYVELFMSDKMISDLGYLKGIGLIPMPQDLLNEWQTNVADRKQLELSDLK
ncbi:MULTISPECIES: PstS family phosphate ABC transporter substrate-binding protein [unclassified Guyparkeria]|uniref:PstS family phosphate ABC transporter substrate-binding protein n=1 Tax=unclassified Guyparkeria TaxID=2626246 RepID=UPI00073342D6|nr:MULTISPECIES: PstS family phosphate ABC transporter substrate-binding protein [unclassified Guyparkeria]KTG16885.1 phosphate-binding protein [Guyparkeria sp. XI15]OAE85919.1 phosphate-binding protein [Guyparkeria sp. WRN-7]